jgi:hypothetical protein
MGTVSQFLAIVRDWEGVARTVKSDLKDMRLWFTNLDAENHWFIFAALAALAVFVMVRRPAGVKHSGDMGRQFALAVALLLAFGFGAGVVFRSLFDLDITPRS